MRCWPASSRAAAWFERALAARPDYAEAHTNYGVLLESLGRSDDAIAHFKKALTARPDHAIALGNMGRLLMRRGRPNEAIWHFDRLHRLQPDNPAAADSLAAAYAAAGDVKRAATLEHEALQLAIAARSDELARVIRGRLQEYEDAAANGSTRLP